MASHVVVVDTSARRTTIKTTPSSLLVEILQQACQKLGRDPDSFILKHNQKTLDLSLTYRLSGLVNGARLELVLSSRSPAVVSVALQFSPTGVDGTQRLTDKVPSNTSLWMLLRHFESSSDPSIPNFTARHVPSPEAKNAGSLWQTPVLQVANREYSDFTDLQRTLAQLGFNSGNLLIRLSHRTTNLSFEEAKQHINSHFASVAPEEESTDLPARKTPAEEAPPVNANNAPKVPVPGISEIATSSLSSHANLNEPSTAVEKFAVSTEAPPALSQPSSNRAVTILAAPTKSISREPQQKFDENDFIPTIDHAKSHQRRLLAAGSNQRMLSDAELEAQAERDRHRMETVREIEVKFRFPDQMQSVTKFSSNDSARNAYDFVKGLLLHENEPFTLVYNSQTGAKTLPRDMESRLRLIHDLRLHGRILMNVVWEEGVSTQAKASPVLKEHFRSQAQEIQVQPQREELTHQQWPAPQGQEIQDSQRKKGGIPKWLKLPGKR